MVLQKVRKERQRHVGLDPASNIFRYFWIPACAGMTVIGLFATLSNLILGNNCWFYL
ncbi:hypothetical protein [Desulforegula conservatrix]|uniref:hypothetical protein n=1 Tax=Desulforegula conservatrix TaxID=153026 RepID=UPI00040B4630|nr:hypothetical protein [Desulforegula conservatrix]